jgi:hypothetical protein
VRPESGARRLIVVPGHGVCLRPERAALDESWAGIFPGEAACLVEHAGRGVALGAQDAEALLVFSGGQTRASAGPRSEAESYRELAAAAGWWGEPAVAARVRCEAFARDSLENLLFALALFVGEMGRRPEHVTVAGWRFKAGRFDLHRSTANWPTDRFTYVGVNDPPGAALAAAQGGEQAKLAALSIDPHLAGDPWRAQRLARDPFGRGHPYRGIDPGLDAVLAGM